MGNYTSPEDETFFAAIGRFVLSWGHLEIALDFAVNTIYHDLGGNTREAEAPRAFSRKVKFFRRSLAHLPINEENLQTYNDFLNTLLTEAENRHDLIHGAAVYHEEGASVAELVRLNKGAIDPNRPTVKVTAVSILQAAVRVQRLAATMFEIAKAIILVARGSGGSDDEKDQ